MLIPLVAYRAIQIIFILFFVYCILRVYKLKKHSLLLTFITSIICFSAFVLFQAITPTVYTIQSCTEYSRKILIVSTNEYKLGLHTYIKNNSEDLIILYPLQYTSHKIAKGINPYRFSAKIKEVKPNETYKITGQTYINYVFKTPPNYITIFEQGFGETLRVNRLVLECATPEYKDWIKKYRSPSPKPNLKIPNIRIQQPKKK